MYMAYICECCKYETPLKTNLNKHLLTQKHILMEKNNKTPISNQG